MRCWHGARFLLRHHRTGVLERREVAADKRSALAEEEGIQGQHFLVRAHIVIPVADADTEFDWGCLASLSRTNFERMKTCG